MKSKIFKRDIEAFDSRTGESNLRLIEMTVEGILLDLGGLHHGYGVQFFYDLGVYGHKEALAYLDNFVQTTTKRHPPTTYAEAFGKLGQIFVTLQGKI